MDERMKNFMRIPNKLWEKLYEMSIPGQERRVFDFIYRQRLGYPRHPRDVSTYSIAVALKLDDGSVRRSIRYLVENRMVFRKGKFKYIQKDFTLWGLGQECPSKVVGQECPNSRAKSEHSVGQECPLREETLKESIKKGFLSKKVDEEQQKKNEEGMRELRKSLGIPEKREKKIQ
jgi:phage replication O-like protein O